MSSASRQMFNIEKPPEAADQTTTMSWYAIFQSTLKIKKTRGIPKTKLIRFLEGIDEL